LPEVPTIEGSPTGTCLLSVLVVNMNKDTLKIPQTTMATINTGTGRKIFHSGSSHLQAEYIRNSSAVVLTIASINLLVVNLLLFMAGMFPL
jgi:hypothetical protein